MRKAKALCGIDAVAAIAPPKGCPRGSKRYNLNLSRGSERLAARRGSAAPQIHNKRSSDRLRARGPGRGAHTP